MPVATPLVNVHGKVTFTPSGGSEITFKNSNWSLKETANIKEAPNTTDGMVRAKGLDDASGSVKGSTDTTTAIEGQVANGAIGVLKLYRDDTRFFSLTAIIDNLSIDAGLDDTEKWSFDFMLQSGTITKPVYP